MAMANKQIMKREREDLVYSIVKGKLEAERKSIFDGMMQNKLPKDLVYRIVKREP